jgi:ATP-binding cassette subfamily B protein
VNILKLPGMVQHQVARGTTRRAFRFARPYRTMIVVFLVIIIAEALTASSVPLFIRAIIDN